VHALRNIDLTVDKGEFVFLVGGSGAGKSTLFRMISALDKITSGKINVSGVDLSQAKDKEVSEFRRRIGVIFQDFKLLKDQTVFENVSLPLKIKGEKPAVIRNKVNDVLDLLGMSLKSHQWVEVLSGGEQQRVAIARAIIHQPSVLIADEPTGNLDPSLAKETMDLLNKVCAQGTTVLVATHDHELIKKYNRRVIELKQGEIFGGRS
jgi:cell division transport system ATP-binding protein